MRKISFTAVVALALLVIGAPAANAGGWYVGGSVGQTSADLGGSVNPGPGISVDDSDTGFKVLGGFNIMKFLAVEAAFVDVGQVSVDGTVQGIGSSVTAEADGFAVEALGIFPFANKFEVFAKAGLYLWDGDVAISGVGSFGDDGTDPTFGLGFGWNAFNRGQVRVEAERYTLDFVGDVDMYSVGFNYRF
jgi:OOP family OmpA-OmpF porin